MRAITMQVWAGPPIWLTISKPALNTFHVDPDTTFCQHPDDSRYDFSNRLRQTERWGIIISAPCHTPAYLNSNPTRSKLTQEYSGERNSLGTSTAFFLRSSDVGMRATIWAAESFSWLDVRSNLTPWKKGMLYRVRFVGDWLLAK